MKYTITSPETEQSLGTVEHRDWAGGSSWDIKLADASSPIVLEGARVSLRNGIMEVLTAGPEGQRMVFPVFHSAGSGVFVVATALGNLRLLPSRGVALEAANGARSGARSIKSSMPGKVLKVLCKPGEGIEAGQPLMIIEAMKMENEIRSPQAGLVEEIGVQPGQSIATGDLLVKIAAEKK